MKKGAHATITQDLCQKVSLLEAWGSLVFCGDSSVSSIPTLVLQIITAKEQHLKQLFHGSPCVTANLFLFLENFIHEYDMI